MTLTLDNLDAMYGALFDLLGPRKPQVLAFKDFIERETSWLTSPASVIVKGPLAEQVGYLARPHLVFDMDEMMHAVAFFERLLPVDDGSAGEEET